MLSKKYNCLACLYKTDLKYNFNRHMVSKHNNNDDVKNPMVDKECCKIFSLKDNKNDVKKPIVDNECVKCGKILSSKNYLQKHLIICKGVSNVLECHLCHKILANSSSKAQHLKICKGIQTYNKNNHATNIKNYIYLLREREFIKSDEHIYKIGKTKRENLKRFGNYPNGSDLLLHITCNDCDNIEKNILSIFKEKFIHKKDIGYEYFEGNHINMMRIINNIVLYCSYYSSYTLLCIYPIEVYAL